MPEPWRSANPSAHSPHTSRHARADRRQRAPAPRIRPVFGDHTGAQALRSVVVAVAVVVTVTRRVPPRRALHRSAFGSGHVEGGHLREAGAEAVSSVGWQCLQSGRAGELAMACLYLSRPRILLDLELQGLSLGKAAEAICVDVALVHEHLLEETTTKLEATNRRGLCACPHAVAAVPSRQAMVPRVCLALLPPAQLTSRSSLSTVMKPKPFWTSNHLHVPLRRSLAPVQNMADARIGANMADLPDHIARDFAIAIFRGVQGARCKLRNTMARLQKSRLLCDGIL